MKKLIIVLIISMFLFPTLCIANWKDELRANGTWSVEQQTPETIKGDALAREQLLNPPPEKEGLSGGRYHRYHYNRSGHRGSYGRGRR